MTNEKYVLAIDQGTTSSRVVVINKNGYIIDHFTHLFEQIINNDTVLQDASYIYLGVKNILDKAIIKYGKENICAIGITNQRETTVAFDKNGKPITYGISWQSKHTKEICETWKSLGYEPHIIKTTGLQINPYFSASKMVKLLENPKVEKHVQNNDCLFGTMDTFLLYNLTDGKSYYTDVTNASRTMLFNIHTLKYDTKTLNLFKIDKNMLPEVKPNKYLFGYYQNIPIKAMIGDQQSALFGHLAFYKGMMKITYGTGAFILMNTGEEVYNSEKGLISTIAYQLDDKPYYALEGSIFTAGSSVKWLKDEFEIINKASETDELTKKSKQRIYFVPAFVGLGAPYWDTDVRGAIFGINSRTTKYDLIKATLEGIGFQVKDVVDVMIKESEVPLQEVHVDGGVSNNKYLMQFQSDLLRCPLIKPEETEITALGAGLIAGLDSLFPSLETIKKALKGDVIYQPQMKYSDSIEIYKGWKKAVIAAQKYK